MDPSVSLWGVSPTLGLHRLCDVGVNGSLRVTQPTAGSQPGSPSAIHVGSRAQVGPWEALRPSRCPCVSRLGVAAHGESRPCLQLTPEATSCTIPDVQMFSMVPYILNVTAVQPWGSSSSFVPFVPEHISECGAHWGSGGCGGPPACPCPSPLSPPTSCHPSCPSVMGPVGTTFAFLQEAAHFSPH